MDLKSVSNYPFFDTHIAFVPKKLFESNYVALFANFKVKRGRNGFEKPKRRFHKCV
jgi:hypothetical protein